MQGEQLKHLQWLGLKNGICVLFYLSQRLFVVHSPAPYHLALEQNNYWRSNAQQDEAKPDISVLLKLSEKVGVVPGILK